MNAHVSAPSDAINLTALQLDADVAPAEEAYDAIEQAADAVARGVEHGTSRERDET